MRTLGASVHDDLGHHPHEEVLEQAQGETEAGPVVSVLHGLQGVTLEVDLVVEVHLVESLHGDLALAVVLDAVMLAVEVQVVLDRASGVLDLLVLAGGDGRGHSPEDHEDGDGGEDGEEDGGVETTADLAGEVPRDHDQQGDEEDIGEAVTPGGVGREGSILDRRVL